MQTTIQLIALSNIIMSSNYRQTEPVDPESPDIIELAFDIKKNGVLQSILVRPSFSKADHYELIFGHRRFVAAQLAGIDTIPASIREVNDEDILELQVTENLQRKDVHPMDEAVAYKTLVEKKNYTTDEIAARFSKSQDYILHRLKLNDLAPGLQAEFIKNKMSMGVALLMCRLTQVDQITVKKAFGAELEKATVGSVKDYINRKIIHDLGNAAWKQTDAELLPSAGPCNTCHKRSGAGNLLFKDMAKDNRCMDAVCFEKKAELAFAKNLKDVIETQPGVHIVHYHYGGNKLSAEITKLLKEMKVKVLKDGEDCHSYGSNGHSLKAKGFYLDGFSKGKIETIYLKGKTAATTKKGATNEKVNVAAEIEGIKQRTARAAELDAEKVHARIIEAVTSHTALTEVDTKLKKVPDVESTAMLFMIYQQLSFIRQQTIKKLMNFKDGKPAQVYEFLKQLSAGEVTFIVRQLMFEDYRGESDDDDEGFIFRKMALSIGVPVAQFDAEQKEIRDKRESRAAERIAALKPATKKAATGKTPAPKKKAAKNLKPQTSNIKHLTNA